MENVKINYAVISEGCGGAWGVGETAEDAYAMATEAVFYTCNPGSVRDDYDAALDDYMELIEPDDPFWEEMVTDMMCEDDRVIKIRDNDGDVVKTVWLTKFKNCGLKATHNGDGKYTRYIGRDCFGKAYATSSRHGWREVTGDRADQIKAQLNGEV